MRSFATHTHTTHTYVHILTHSQAYPQVSGEEEIPEGVVAVLTPDAPDVLSHVSVRARNMRVLFATCHDPEPLEQIKVRYVTFQATSACVRLTRVCCLPHATTHSCLSKSRCAVLIEPLHRLITTVGHSYCHFPHRH